ncbi:hypothetical protein GCM10022248_00890 [Nonomuraea soli]
MALRGFRVAYASSSDSEGGSAYGRMIRCAPSPAYLAATHAFAALRLLSMGDRDKDVEVLVLRYQVTVLARQLGPDTTVRFAPEDRAYLAAFLTSPPREVLRQLRLLILLTRSCAGSVI